jgi:parvulin-like peptidyl-prolyl isomerase
MFNSRFQIGVLLIFGATLACQAGDVVDRIVAMVNNHPILQSDWDEQVAYEALAEGRPLASVSEEQRKAALDRLIDRELVNEQAEHAALPQTTPEEVDRRIEKIRKLYASPEDWQEALQKYDLTEKELRAEASAELNEMHAVDAHLRPGIQVDSRSVESYYREKLLPELRQSGAREVPLEQVAGQIRELLAQQKMNDLLALWIRSLRSESDIRVPSTPSGRGGGGK